MLSDQQILTDEPRPTLVHFQHDEIDSSTFRTRTVNQPPISIAPPKLSDLTSRADAYRMIPIERMEQIRQETAQVLDRGIDGEQQSKIKKLVGKKKKATKKRRPSARLRRKVAALTQAIVDQQRDTSSDEPTDTEDMSNKNGVINGDDNDDDDDDDGEPFVIKQSMAVSNGLKTKSIISVADSTSDSTEQNV
jgi:hypothetical protein